MLGDSSAAMYPGSQAEQFSLAKFERVRLLGSNELPVYDLGETRRSGAMVPDLIEHAVPAVMVTGGAAFVIAIAWWIAG